MKLRAINPPLADGTKVQCSGCQKMVSFALADLSAAAFPYFCRECAARRVEVVRTERGYWNLVVDGKVMMVEESFTVVDRVRDALLGRTVGGEMGEVARSIERSTS